MTNTGRPYEELTEQVLRRLLAQENLCTNVRRGTTIQGKSTAHEIDVSFDFEVGPTKYLTIVQCKDWASAVKQEQVLAFLAVLDDIPGQPRGIMVSRSGFQEGACNVARHHGIVLYELRDPKDEDWKGLFRRIQVELVVQNPEYRNVAPCLDESWLHRECDRLGIGPGRIDVKIVQDPTVVALESGGYCDLRSPLSQHLPSQADEWTPIRHEFPEGLMFRVGEGPIPLVRAYAVTAEVRVTFSRRTISVSCDHLVAYCFRDVLTGTSRFLDKDGNAVGGGAKKGEP